MLCRAYSTVLMLVLGSLVASGADLAGRIAERAAELDAQLAAMAAAVPVGRCVRRVTEGSLADQA